MESQDSFNEKVVVVTGASSGLGRAIVREFAKKGARLGLLARGKDGLDGARRDVEELGGEAITVPTDVSDYSQVESAAEQVEKRFGPVDIWINNAMTSVLSPVKGMDAKEFQRVTEVTYLGQVYGTKVALKSMLPRDSGTIVLVGSALAYRGIPLQSAYCGAKHAILGFFESLRSELIHDKSNIQLSMVQLPALNTPQFNIVKNRLPQKAKPMGTIFQPEVAARAILKVARDHKREACVGYSTVQTIVGNKLVPGYMDRYLADIGYDDQQTGEEEDPDKPNNLWSPVPGDHGARGDFNSQAWNFSSQYWMAEHPWMTGAALGMISLGVGSVLNKFLSDK